MRNATTTSIDLALAALFDYCVPSVSGGFLKSGYDQEQLIPLSEAEKSNHLEVVLPEADYFRIRDAKPVAIVEIDPPQCRVMTSGNPHDARELFLGMLQKRGWEIFRTLEQPDESQTIGTWIDLSRSEKLVISFTVRPNNPHSGFFASTYRVARRN